MSNHEGITFTLDDDSTSLEDQEEDLHLCGRCRTTFADIAEFFNHKKLCKEQSKKKLDNNDFNLATDEAAVISLLANQLSSQNSQPRASDDLDHLTLVFKEELDAIANPDLSMQQQQQPKPPKKTEKQVTKVQTTSIKTADNQTKIAVKLVKGERKIHPCSLCKFTAQHPKDLTRHIRSHTGEKPFSCKYCSKNFSRQDKVKNHERIHTGEKPYVCQLCPYGTADSGSLKKHMRIHTDERPFKCQLCPYRSRDSSQLTVHLRTHTNDRPFVCPHETCGSAFKTNSDLKRHLRLHNCPHCPFKSASQITVKAHITTDHKELISSWKCSQCPYTTNNQIKLNTHEKMHENLVDKPLLQHTHFKCEDCEFTCSTKLKLTSHVRKKHHKQNDFYGQIVNCQSCDYSTTSQALLLVHRRKKHPRSKSSKKKFQVKDDQKPEIIALKKETPTKKQDNYVYNYSCNLCEATFVREDSLKSHLRQHQQRRLDVELDLLPEAAGPQTSHEPQVINQDSYQGPINDSSVQYLLFATPSNASTTSSSTVPSSGNHEIHILANDTLTNNSAGTQVIYQVAKE